MAQKIRGQNHEIKESEINMIDLTPYAAVLRAAPIFREIDGMELPVLLDCLGGSLRVFGKSGVLLLAGERPAYIGVVLSGLLHIVREDRDGKRALIAAAAPGELFAEALCCAGVAESPVTVLASENSHVLLLRFDRILRTCPNACARHQKLVENLLRLVAAKTLVLQERMELLEVRSIREKVLRYLETLAAVQGRRVTVPFNREELAAYLNVERSALSHALMKMRREGLIEYRKNVFTLL